MFTSREQVSSEHGLSVNTIQQISEQVLSEHTYQQAEQGLSENNSQRVFAEKVWSGNNSHRNSSLPELNCELTCNQRQKIFKSEAEYSLHKEFFHSEKTIDIDSQ